MMLAGLMVVIVSAENPCSLHVVSYPSLAMKRTCEVLHEVKVLTKRADLSLRTPTRWQDFHVDNRVCCAEIPVEKKHWQMI